MSQQPDITRHDLVERIEKSWGYELIFANSPLYCGKKLVIHPGEASSRHFHIDKTEHILVASGCLTIEVTDNKKKTNYVLDKGDCILITPGMVHRLMNNEDAMELELYEFSTQSFDEDSYRID